MPTVEASVQEIMGRRVVFLTLGTDHREAAYAHGTSVAITGERAAVQDLLDQCSKALEGLEA